MRRPITATYRTLPDRWGAGSLRADLADRTGPSLPCWHLHGVITRDREAVSAVSAGVDERQRIELAGRSANLWRVGRDSIEQLIRRQQNTIGAPFR